MGFIVTVVTFVRTEYQTYQKLPQMTMTIMTKMIALLMQYSRIKLTCGQNLMTRN